MPFALVCKKPPWRGSFDTEWYKAAPSWQKDLSFLHEKQVLQY